MNRSYYRHRVLIPSIIMVALVVLILGLLSWGNYLYAQRTPGGDHFLVQWAGTRVFITGGIDPYSQEANDKIDILAEKYLVDPDLPSLRFVSPIYSVIFFLPFLAIPDFLVARTIWLTVMEAALIIQALLCVRLVGWKPSWVSILFFCLFTIFGYHSLFSMLNGDMSILAGLCLVGGFLALKNNGDELAGVLFAFATIKLHMVYLFIVFMIYWGFRQKRWALVGWFFITFILFSLSLMLLLPDWIIQCTRQIVGFFNANSVGTLSDMLAGVFPGFGGRIGWIVCAILSFVVIFEWRLAGKRGFNGFLWAGCLTLSANQWLTVQVDARNGIMLLSGLAFVFCLWQERWRIIGKVIFWISIVLLTCLPWLIYTSQIAMPDRQEGLLALILPLFSIITLYWVRWWAIKPTNLWFTQVKPPIR